MSYKSKIQRECYLAEHLGKACCYCQSLIDRCEIPRKLCFYCEKVPAEVLYQHGSKAHLISCKKCFEVQSKLSYDNYNEKNGLKKGWSVWRDHRPDLNCPACAVTTRYFAFIEEYPPK